jgi:hypothetical protein
MKQFFLAISILLLLTQVANAAPATHATTQPIAVRRLLISGENGAMVQGVLNKFDAIKSNHPNVVNSDSYQFLLNLGITSREVSINVDYPSKVVTLRIDLSEFNPNGNDAGKIADRFIAMFTDRFCGGPIDQLHQDERQFEHNQVEMDELRARHDGLAKELREATGAVDVSTASVRDRLASLQTQKESATIELAAKQARSDALANQISNFSSQIQDKIKSDPIAAELSKIVGVRQKEFDRAQSTNKAGGATAGDVDQAMASLAEAKAKLLEREEAAANAAGGDIIAGWNRELMTLSVDLAELRARSKALDDRLATYAKADNYLDNADQWLVEISDLQKQASVLQERVNAEEADYEHNRVSMEVLKTLPGSTTQPEK